MSTFVFEKAVLVLCLFALACGAKPKDAPAPAPAGAAKVACRVCGIEAPSDRVVVVRAADGSVTVCSQGCAIRYEVGMTPESAPATRAELPESEPEEDR